MRTVLMKTLMAAGVFCLLAGLAGQASAELTGYWPLDEGSGDVAYDVISGNDGAITGAVWDLPGIIGNSALGGGSVNCGPDAAVEPDLTVAFWMKANALGHTQPILASAGNYSPLPGWRAMLRAEGGVWFRIEGSDAGGWAGGDLHIGEVVYEVGKWVHMAFTFDSETGEINAYINGELKGTKVVATGRTIADTTQDLVFGANGGYNGSLDEIGIWDNALTAEEVMNVYKKGVNPFNPEPDPGDGDTVIAQNPLTLSWKNIEPIDVNVPTTVDVYFGTDPCNLGDPIVAGQAVTSADVDASETGTYYWRVDSYIGEPNAVKGEIWSFTTVSDPAPEIDSITPDQMTWVGEPVSLEAIISNDGPSLTIIEWLEDSDDSIDVAVTGGDTATPTVTVTKVPYPNAMVPNAGFEKPIMGDGDSSWAAPDGWFGSACGPWNPGVEGTGWPAFGGEAPEGQNVLFVNNGGVASTVLQEKIQAGVTYTLSVDVGLNVTYGANARYKVELRAGDGEDSAVVAEDDNGLNIALGTFETSTVEFTCDPVEDANKVGLPLMISLKCTSTEDPSSDVEFDNVVLTADTPFPVITGVKTVTMTVLASDAENPTPVEASVEIQVYDDACHMARAGKGLDIETDFNESCIVKIGDMLLLAENWLADSGLKDPVNDKHAYIGVPNGDFQLMFKPGTTITGDILGVGWTKGVGPGCEMDGGSNLYEFADGTTGNIADIPGWVGYDPETWIALGGTYGRDTESGNNQGSVGNQGETEDNMNYLANGGSWGNPAGGLIISEIPLGTVHSAKYTLSMVCQQNGGAATPIRLDLVTEDGVVITPSSSTDPALTSTNWEPATRVYEPNELDPNSIEQHIGKAFKIVLGTDRNCTGAQTRYDDVTLQVEVTDTDLPTVNAGEDMIIWPGQAYTLAGSVTDNDTQGRTLSNLWTAYPADGVKFSDPTAADSTVTFTNPGKVVLVLTSTLEGVGVVSDAVAFNVYGTSCLAAMADNPNLTYDLTDINTDCVTNLADFANLAADWLIDYRPEGPEDVPVEE